MSRHKTKSKRPKERSEARRWLPNLSNADAKWAFFAMVLSVLVAISTLAKDLLSPVVVGWMEREDTLSPEDRLLAAANPTSIDVEKVDLAYWEGGPDPFLTVHFKNSSKLSAHSIQVVSPSLDEMPKPPTVTRQLMTRNVGLVGGDYLQVPIATMADARRRIAESKPGFTLVGAGTKSNLPSGLALGLCGPSENVIGHCDADGASVIVPLRYRFTNTFREEVEIVTAVYLYAARLRFPPRLGSLGPIEGSASSELRNTPSQVASIRESESIGLALAPTHGLTNERSVHAANLNSR